MIPSDPQYTTPTAAFNADYAIDRLRAELRRLAADAGGTIRAGHRTLGQLVGCSAARICDLMRRLEALGEIARERFKNSYLIRVIDQGDRSGAGGDRSGVIDQGLGVIDHPQGDLPPPHQDAAETAATGDRVNAAYKVLDHDSSQEEESARTRVPIFSRLMRQPTMDRRLAERIAASPPGDVADFEADLALAEKLPRIARPFWFTVHKWAAGQRVVGAEETPHGPGASRPDTADQRRNGARRGYGGEDRQRPTGGERAPRVGELAYYTKYLTGSAYGATDA